MLRVGFDLESNGLLDKLTKLHCIGLKDLDNPKSKVLMYDTQEGIEEALRTLMNADEIMGHNIIAFDIPAIQKVYKWFSPKGKVTDTLVISRLVYADLKNDDRVSVALPENFKKFMHGSHSLKAWGMRLGNYKGDFDGGDWQTWTQEMSDYCVQDVIVTCELFEHLNKKAEGFSQQSLDLEHELAEICYRIGNNGWTFDVEGAEKLYTVLVKRRIDIEKNLSSLFEPWEIHTDFTPKVNNKTRGYVKGEVFTKVQTIHFNPNSRKHISYCLIKKYNWKPKEYTPSGEPKIDETVLSKLAYPEAKTLAEFFLLQKRIAQLAEGSQAWLKRVDSDGRLRHTIVSGGTVSGRASHRNPNLGQVTGNNSLYGKEMRSLFGVPPGWTLVGTDLEQLELRCLAHYLPDDGEYARQIEHGDIHQYNADATGLSRVESKRFIYSLIYGGGNQLIGNIVGGGMKEGAKLKADFNKNVPAFKLLQQQLREAYSRGHLLGLDGRKLYIRGEHILLSQLLQSAGAILAKQWLALADREIKKQQLNSYIVGWIHDELQTACPKEEAAHVGSLYEALSIQAGKTFEIEKVRITSSSQLGANWSATH